jgi:hypothetical protein
MEVRKERELILFMIESGRVWMTTSPRKLLSRSTIGARVCVSLLDGMVKLYDAEESSEGAQAFDVG